MRGYSQCNVNWLNGFVGNLDLSEAITGGVVSAGDFIKEETLVQVFSCEFCEIFQNTVSGLSRVTATQNLARFGKVL